MYDRLKLSFDNHVHQCGLILVGPTVRPDDLQLKTPDVAQVLRRCIACGRTADQKTALMSQHFERRYPGVSADIVHNYVHAATAHVVWFAEPLAHCLQNVFLGGVDYMSGSDFLEPAQLPFRASAGDYFGPDGGAELNTTSPHSSCGAENQYFLARSDRSTRLHHAQCCAVCNRERGSIDKRESFRHSQKVGYRHGHQFAARSRESLTRHSPVLDVWVRTNAITGLPGAAAVHPRPQSNDFS